MRHILMTVALLSLIAVVPLAAHAGSWDQEEADRAADERQLRQQQWEENRDEERRQRAEDAAEARQQAETYQRLRDAPRWEDNPFLPANRGR